MVLAEILLLLLAFPSVSLASEAEAEASEGDTASADATCGYLYERIVSIADLHGDLEKAKKVLKLTGVVGENGEWLGKMNPFFNLHVYKGIHSLPFLF